MHNSDAGTITHHLESLLPSWTGCPADVSTDTDVVATPCFEGTPASSIFIFPRILSSLSTTMCSVCCRKPYKREAHQNGHSLLLLTSAFSGYFRFRLSLSVIMFSSMRTRNLPGVKHLSPTGKLVMCEHISYLSSLFHHVAA
jgi:hypothetical protein